MKIFDRKNQNAVIGLSGLFAARQAGKAASMIRAVLGITLAATLVYHYSKTIKSVDYP
jgi:hypothetical protein